MAALGTTAASANAVWVARDAISSLPRAYVALSASDDVAKICSAPGLDGSATDAGLAEAAVRRYAHDALGLITN